MIIVYHSYSGKCHSPVASVIVKWYMSQPTSDGCFCLVVHVHSPLASVSLMERAGSNGQSLSVRILW